MTTLADRLDALLPQTQCTRCGYPACRPYAEAMAAGQAPINRCPPGGDAGVRRLATSLGRDVIALDPACGETHAVERIARVVEADCIGCTKCIQVCPVDAIVGAMNLMHTVLDDECNGCELCLPVCPVDCIVMEDAPSLPPAYERAPQFRARYEARTQRLARWSREDEARRRERRAAAAGVDPVADALRRAQARPS